MQPYAPHFSRISLLPSLYRRSSLFSFPSKFILSVSTPSSSSIIYAPIEPFCQDHQGFLGGLSIGICAKTGGGSSSKDDSIFAVICKQGRLIMQVY